MITVKLFSLFFLPLFQGEESSSNWLTIVVGVVLLLGFIGLLVWLYTNGTLTQWVQAGTQSGKWKLRNMQLVNDAKKTERIKISQINELGQKAWKSGVSDPSYAQAWADLEAIETQIETIRQYARSLQDNLNVIHTQKDDVTKSYDDQIMLVDNQRKDTENNLKSAQSELRQLENELESLAYEKGILQRDIKATRTDLINREGIDDSDREEILGSLNARLDGLVHNLLEVSNAEPELAARIPTRQSEVLTLNSRVTELSEQIRQLDIQKNNDVEPLNQQVEALEKQIKNKNDEALELEKKMEPMINSLGHMVDTARPPAQALDEDYTRLNATYQKLASASQERTDLAAKLDGLDKDAARNFYLLIVLGVIVLVIALLLFTGVL